MKLALWATPILALPVKPLWDSLSQFDPGYFKLWFSNLGPK
jgi:hypothetical protein